MKKGRRLGEALVEAGVVTAEQLARAFSFQREVGGTLGEVLQKLGFVQPEALLEALAAQTGIGSVNLLETEVPREVLALVSYDTVRSRRVLPVGLENKRLVLGMMDPTDLAAISDAEFQSGHGVRPAVLSAAQFRDALEVFAAGGYATAPLRLSDRPEAAAGEGSDIFALLRLLVGWRGQDLHLSAGAVPAIRMDNEMKRVTMPPLEAGQVEGLVAPLLTELQRRQFAEDLELDFAYSFAGIGRFRCNLYRQRGSVAFTARHVSDRIPSAEELGLPAWVHEHVLRPQGLILVCGPNGHGKTTTLAHLVEHVNRSRKSNIITIEDPVEYTFHHRLSNVNQREIGTDTRSFAEGLRRIFRQNPDVIVIGELRDPETFEIALSAAGTGHLVLGTLHALSATGALERVIEMFPGERQQQVRTQLAEALLLVLSQRLVRRATGTGRVLALEHVATSVRVRNAIREGKVHQLRSLMQGRGEEYQGIDESLAGLVATGRARLEEAAVWAENPGHLAELVRMRGGGRPS